MTGPALTGPFLRCEALTAAAFDRWHDDRLVEARLILAEAPRHQATLVALATRVLADATRMGGAS